MEASNPAAVRQPDAGVVEIGGADDIGGDVLRRLGAIFASVASPAKFIKKVGPVSRAGIV